MMTKRSKRQTGGAPGAVPPKRRGWPHVAGLPQTVAGRWSLWLASAGVLCFGLLNVLVAAGQRGGATFFDNPWLSAAALGMGTGLLAGGGAAALAILRQRERSALVYLVLLGGGVALFFVLGELLVPH